MEDNVCVSGKSDEWAQLDLFCCTSPLNLVLFICDMNDKAAFSFCYILTEIKKIRKVYLRTGY